jgi:hypothetical protein
MKTLHTLALAALCALAPASAALAQEGPRQRWEQLSPEEQALLRERFQQFEGLDPAQRDELLRRHARLRAEQERVLARLPEDARQRLATLDPERRRQVLLDLAHAELLRRGARLRARLPQEMVERLEQAPPQERRALMRDYLEGLRGQSGRPPRPGLRPPGAPRPAGPPPPLTPTTRDTLRDVAHPDPEWILELADLPPLERRRQVEARVRERVLGVLRDSAELTPEQLGRLEALRGPPFREALRRLLGSPPRRGL